MRDENWQTVPNMQCVKGKSLLIKVSRVWWTTRVLLNVDWRVRLQGMSARYSLYIVCDVWFVSIIIESSFDVQKQMVWTGLPWSMSHWSCRYTWKNYVVLVDLCLETRVVVQLKYFKCALFFNLIIKDDIFHIFLCRLVKLRSSRGRWCASKGSNKLVKYFHHEEM